MIRPLVRRLILAVPPVRRLHAFATDEGRRADVAEEHLADQLRECDRLAEECERLRREYARVEEEAAGLLGERETLSARLLAEQAETRDRHDRVERELYLLRSDLHRAAERNERLSQALAAASFPRKE